MKNPRHLKLSFGCPEINGFFLAGGFIVLRGTPLLVFIYSLKQRYLICLSVQKAIKLSILYNNIGEICMICIIRGVALLFCQLIKKKKTVPTPQSAFWIQSDLCLCYRFTSLKTHIHADTLTNTHVHTVTPVRSNAEISQLREIVYKSLLVSL